jgi:hypothetical protein
MEEAASSGESGGNGASRRACSTVVAEMCASVPPKSGRDEGFGGAAQICFFLEFSTESSRHLGIQCGSRSITTRASHTARTRAVEKGRFGRAGAAASAWLFWLSHDVRQRLDDGDVVFVVCRHPRADKRASANHVPRIGEQLGHGERLEAKMLCMRCTHNSTVRCKGRSSAAGAVGRLVRGRGSGGQNHSRGRDWAGVWTERWATGAGRSL